jgi:hypothetical protein
MDKELYEYLVANDGGVTIMGSQVCPTLVSRISSAVGNTQDNMIVVCLINNEQE